MPRPRVLIPALLLTLLLSACQGVPPELFVALTPTATVTAPPPSATPTDEPVAETPTETPTEAPTEVESSETDVADVEDTEALALIPIANEAMGIEVLVPEGWQEMGPGVYARGNGPTDVVTLIQQAAPGATADQLAGVLVNQLGIDALPEPVGEVDANGLVWTIRKVEVEVPGLGALQIDIALSESDEAAYVILFQALPDEYEILRPQIFLAALEGFQRAGAQSVQPGEDETSEEETSEEETSEETSARYEDPEGRFSFPIPTNWMVREEEGYVVAASPDDEILIHIVVVEEDDPIAGIEAGWEIVDPGFDLEAQETTDLPPEAAGGIDRFVLITYDTDVDGGEPIVQAEGRLYDGQVYTLLVSLELEAVQRRIAQVQLIDSGFEISALEKVDLSDAEPRAIDEAILSELEIYIGKMMEDWDVPGAAVAIVRDGEQIYAQGFGVRTLGDEEPVSPETMMMIGSTTKPLTTMLLAQLVDEEVLDWDTPVVEIWPDFRVADEELSQTLTVRNLVCACTGVPRRDFEWFFNANELSAEGTMESLADFEFFTEFGEAFQYSNQMVAAAGYLAALAAGGEYGTLQEDYTALIQERLFDPMGMTQTTFSFDTIESMDDFAMPHAAYLTGEMTPISLDYEKTLIPLSPAGALWSNVDEMSLFLITLLNGGVGPDGDRIVSIENLEETWQPQVEINADAGYGLGWIVEDYKGVRVLSHGGNTQGFSSELALLPEQDLGIAVLTNQQGSVLNGAVRLRLLELLYEQPAESVEIFEFQLNQVEEARTELGESLQRSVDGEAVADHLGSYANDILGSMELSFEDDLLIADVGEFVMQIGSRENDEGELRYLTTAPPLLGLPLEFSEDDEGNPIIVIGLGLVEYTFEKIE